MCHYLKIKGLLSKIIFSHLNILYILQIIDRQILFNVKTIKKTIIYATCTASSIKFCHQSSHPKARTIVNSKTIQELTSLKEKHASTCNPNISLNLSFHVTISVRLVLEYSLFGISEITTLYSLHRFKCDRQPCDTLSFYNFGLFISVWLDSTQYYLVH